MATEDGGSADWTQFDTTGQRDVMLGGSKRWDNYLVYANGQSYYGFRDGRLEMMGREIATGVTAGSQERERMADGAVLGTI